MNVFSETIREFAHRLNLPPSTEPSEGVVEFAIERLGRLQLEEAEGCVLTTLARPFSPNSSRGATEALLTAHWREGHPWPLNAGLAGEEWLTLTFAIPLRAFDLPALDRALALLGRLHDRIEKEG